MFKTTIHAGAGDTPNRGIWLSTGRRGNIVLAWFVLGSLPTITNQGAQVLTAIGMSLTRVLLNYTAPCAVATALVTRVRPRDRISLRTKTKERQKCYVSDIVIARQLESVGIVAKLDAPLAPTISPGDRR